MEAHNADNNGGQDELDSLFEGMVLMTPSQIDTLETPAQLQRNPENESSIGISAVSQPLDENLFSDLNLCSINEDSIDENSKLLALDSNRENNISNGLRKGPLLTRSVEVTGSRQGSRRKKKSFKIGYGRNDYSFDDGLQTGSNNLNQGNNNNNNHSDNILEAYSSAQVHANVDDQGVQLQINESKEEPNFDILDNSDLSVGGKKICSEEIPMIQRPSSEEVGSSIDTPNLEITAEKRESDVVEAAERCESNHVESVLQTSVEIEDADFDVARQSEHQPIGVEPTGVSPRGHSTEKNLADIKDRLSMKLKELQEKAASISISRKAAAQRRRQAAEEVNIASNKYKEIEKELEDACEREDFERAESLSESLLSVEKSKEAALNTFRSAEADCDSMVLKMQEILELQVAVEEEGIRLLQSLQKEAIDTADTLIKEAENTAANEMEKWQLEKEALELKKLETDIELKIIEDADAKLRESINDSVREDMEEKKILFNTRETLMQELQHLLALVKAKEEEISESDMQIQSVEKRISDRVSKFEENLIGTKEKSEELQCVLGQLQTNSEILSMKKMEVDQLLTSVDQKRVNLVRLADNAGDEARVLQELVDLRKLIVSSFLQSRENKVKLAEKEEQISQEVQELRQQVAAARSSLQELSSAKANLNQEITSMKQKLLFIDKRGPELEAEKKVAAAARNFKEAGRVAAEAKALSLEKDDVSHKMERALSDLQKLEEEIKGKVTVLQEAENLIISKERDAAMARCERLRLVAASAREEWSAALEVEDIEEAGNLLAEAEAADSEADKLQEVCNFDGDQFIKVSKQFISVAMASTLMGKQLTEKSTCVETSNE